MAYAMAVKFTFYDFREFFSRGFSDLQISAYDIHRDTVSLYYRLCRGHGFALYQTEFSQALSMSVCAAISISGNFSVPGDDDFAGAGHLVEACDMACYRIDYLFYL